MMAPPAGLWACRRNLSCCMGSGALRSDYGAASGFEGQRLLKALGFCCFFFFGASYSNSVDYNTAIYSRFQLLCISPVSCPSSGHRTLSDFLTEEGEAALCSNLYIFRRMRRYILRLSVATSPTVNPNLDQNVYDGTCSMKVIAESVVQGNLRWLMICCCTPWKVECGSVKAELDTQGGCAVRLTQQSPGTTCAKRPGMRAGDHPYIRLSYLQAGLSLPRHIVPS